MTKNKLHVRKGDTVEVIAGKDKGKQAKVLRAMPETSRVIVEGTNMHKKAVRPTQTNAQGGINDIEAPMHASNVMLVCPSCKKPTRVGVRTADDGKRVRYCKKCNEVIDK